MTLLHGMSTRDKEPQPKPQQLQQPSTSPPTDGSSSSYPYATVSNQLRRGRPSQVQTTFAHQAAMVTSVTPSSATSTCHDFPILTPETTSLATWASSMQTSPEVIPSINPESPSATPFSLPDPLQPVSKQSSNTSLAQPGILSPADLVPPPARETRERAGFIRRFSSRKKNTSSTRQSSVTPRARDASFGPAIMRRRSDSNTTAPPESAMVVSSDSEEDTDRLLDVRYLQRLGFESPLLLEGFGSAAGSSMGGTSESSSLNPGIIAPPSLTQGTFVTKVKSKKQRRFALTLDLDSSRILWEKKFVDVSRIREIRTGSDTSQTRLDCGIQDSDESRFFSIIYDDIGHKSKKKTLNIMCDDVETQRIWVETLEQMNKHLYSQITSLSAFHDKAVKDYWQTEMTKKFGGEPHAAEDESIDLNGIERLCQFLHIWVPTTHLRAKFRAADITGTNRLDYSEFLAFVGYMRQRDDISTLFNLIARDRPKGLTLDLFLEFVKETQGEDVESDRQRWERVFDVFTSKPTRDLERTSDSEDIRPRMSKGQLADFLSSVDNAPLIPAPTQYDLDRPCNEYFISSSHNTYLLGRQVAAASSVEGYISALVRGCRCVEVDCWDGTDGSPVVKHGYALTTQISFKEVMNTINKYAFSESSFPLWISLEVHCCPVQQEEMATMIRDTFGSKLITEPLDPTSDQLPSPSQLMGRILIKVKKPGETHSNGGGSGRRRGNSLNSPTVSSPFAKPLNLENSLAASFPSSPLHSPSMVARGMNGTRMVRAIAEGEVHDAVHGYSDSEGIMEGYSAGRKIASVKIVKVLGELGVYNQGIKFNNSSLDGPDSKRPNHIYSLKESSFDKFCARSKENKQAIFRHNMKYFMRVYPVQTRIKSDNFDPLIYWRRGVQMCALNWQTFDLPMQINQAMFAGGTDKSGYVLKPAELREIQRVADRPQELASKRPRKQVKFTIEVVSAQQLTHSSHMPAGASFDPYVEVEIYHANDKRDKKEDRSSVMSPVENLRACTEVVQGNGFNPVFNRKFEFVVTTKFPELIFVRWTVRLSHDSERPNAIGDRAPPLAVYTAKLLSLKKGYRTLPLYTHGGDRYLFSTLFCRATVNQDDISDVYLPCRNEPPETSGNVLKSITRSIFSRSNTISKSTEPAV